MHLGLAAYLRQGGWKYSSAADYNGAKGLIEITKLEPLLIV
jgi:hypothetical protein